MSGLLALVLGAMGVVLLVWAARTGRGVATPVPPPVSQAVLGERALVSGQVLAPPSALTSPLQGVACAYWHVRAVRIRERNAAAGASGLRVQVDVAVSSDTPFAVRTADGDVTVQPSGSRMASGLQVVHRDQGSLPRSLVVAGRSHELPPVAHGTRQVQEGTLAPGQAVWVEGTLASSPGGAVVAGDADQPLVIDTTPLAARRRTAAAIAGLAAVVGLVLVIAALALVTA